MVELNGVTKSYPIGKEGHVQVLVGIDLALRAGEFMALMGPSGSGKSTLMNIIGCLDRHDKGRYILDGDNVGELDDDGLSSLRGTKIGFVFQFFNLIPQLDVRENVELPLFYQGVSRSERRQRAEHALERVGLAHRVGHRPNQISGGEMQRVAIARSLITDPILLIGDEPTGNLDSKTGKAILELFHQLHAQGVSLLLVTHDRGVGEQAERVLHMRDGALVDDKTVSQIAVTP
ncbi:MAG: ABC transporter ATP-binding protein [Planctomycetota bacterium]|nr:ABC transporter ATP-binding protein [Planctomycetota bacterium]